MRIYETGSGRSIIGRTVKGGLSFGAALAMVVSFGNWGSLPWAAFHGLLGWIYIVYYILRYGLNRV